MIKTFRELKKDDYIYHLANDNDGIPVVRKEKIHRITHYSPYVSFFCTDMGERMVYNNRTKDESYATAIATSEEEIKPIFKKFLDRKINSDKEQIKILQKNIDKCEEYIKNIKW